MKTRKRSEPGDPDRRRFLRTLSGASAGFWLAGASLWAAGEDPVLASVAPDRVAPASAATQGPADVTLRIGTVLVDLTKDRTISTVGYNGGAPGSVIRLREGVPVTVDLFNDTDTPEYVHWHGQIIPPDVDGAPQENSLHVPPRGHLRYRLTPLPAGAR